MGGSTTRTASLLLTAGDVKRLSVRYKNKDGQPLAYNPGVVWSDAGDAVPLDAEGRDGHADVRPLVPEDNNVSNKQRKDAERFLRTELARLCRPEGA